MYNQQLEGYGDLLSIKDLVEIFNVCKTTIYKEVKKGSFGKPICIGRALKFPKVVILERYFNVTFVNTLTEGVYSYDCNC